MNKHKITTIAVLLALPFILTACTLFDKVPEPKDTETMEEETSMQEDKMEEKNDGMVTSVINALKNNKVLSCTYVDEDGDETDVLIKGDRVYAKGNDNEDSDEGNLRGLVTNDKYYLWNVETNEGAYFNLETDDEDGIKMNGKEIKNSAEMIEELEKNSKNCKFTTADSSLFEIPDIGFVEWDL